MDWNCQIHATQPPDREDEVELAKRTLTYVGRTLSNALHLLSSGTRFDVTLRLYGGWQRGFEVTARRKAVMTVGASFPALSTRSTVAIRPILEFGDRLLSAAAHRLHPRLHVHLSDTYRQSLHDKSRMEEKMVDTAIAADLVDLAYRETDRWLIVLGEDDDLVPPLMVANDIRALGSGKVIMVRRRSETPFLRFDDLRVWP